MIENIIQFSLRQKILIVSLSFILVGIGVWSARNLSIDAVPDVTNVQVQINTEVQALAPTEIEKLVTYPIEVAMSGLPDVEEVRSLSRYGLSQVTVVFKDHVNIYFARQLVLERLQQAKEEIPEGAGTPILGPIATGLGEIFLYTVEGENIDPTELRTIHDWIIKPQLRTVPGVTEVNPIGGYEKEYQVLADPKKLSSYGITLEQVFEALAQNNANAGGGYIEKREEQYLVRGIGLIQSLDDIRSIVITTEENVPIFIRDVAQVQFGAKVRTGSATRDGKETVLGTAIMLKGENSRVVSTRVRHKLEEIKKTLPPGAKIETVYDRTHLVNKTIHTVQKNLFEGGIFVMAVLLLLLGNIRAGLIVASAIPLSMLFAMTGMVATQTSGNLMSLGAIDFGLIVDGAVVMVENIVRRLSERKKTQKEELSSQAFLEEIAAAAQEVSRPVVFAVSIITIVYLPILTLEGIEGKMFRPMATTVVFALIGSLILTLTLIPVLCSFFLKGHVEEKESRAVTFLQSKYQPSLSWAMNHKKPVIISALGVVLISFMIFPFLGSEFIPRLDEEAISIQSVKPTGMSLTESTKMAAQLEKVIRSFPEVSTTFSRTGTAEVATDPMGPNVTDTYIMLKGKVKNKEELVERMEKAVAVIPGMNFGFSQPIELRVNELIAGVRSDVAIKIFGEDLNILKEKADEIVKVVSKIPGAKDVKAEQTEGTPVLQIEIDRAKIARYGMNASQVLGLIEMAVAGKSAGQVFEGVKRFDLTLRYPQEYRNHAEAISNLLVTSPQGHKIPLAQLTKRIVLEEGPAQISHEQASRRVVIEINVRGRDIGSFVAEAQKAIDEQIKLPAGYAMDWGGQFENLQSARQRLLIVVPISLLLIFMLLFFTFNSLQQAALVFTGIPFAVTGGVLALLIRGMPFSISAGVGFIALFGVAMLNGVVMVSFINQLRKEGMSVVEATMKGAESRLRPVLMTALVASLGFLPMALSHGTGAEVQRPLAMVVIGGLISSTVLTLILLPILYSLFEKDSAAEKAF